MAEERSGGAVGTTSEGPTLPAPAGTASGASQISDEALGRGRAWSEE
jgi:hypothetical protein